jgi:hypothetical protein
MIQVTVLGKLCVPISKRREYNLRPGREGAIALEKAALLSVKHSEIKVPGPPCWDAARDW